MTRITRRFYDFSSIASSALLQSYPAVISACQVPTLLYVSSGNKSEVDEEAKSGSAALFYVYTEMRRFSVKRGEVGEGEAVTVMRGSADKDVPVVRNQIIRCHLIWDEYRVRRPELGRENSLV